MKALLSMNIYIYTSESHALSKFLAQKVCVKIVITIKMLTCIKLNHLKTNYTLPCTITVLVHVTAKTVLASICLSDKNQWLLLWVTYFLLLHRAVILWGMGDITNVLSVKKERKSLHCHFNLHHYYYNIIPNHLTILKLDIQTSYTKQYTYAYKDLVASKLCLFKKWQNNLAINGTK
jgi:hypothetical protein